MYTVQRDNSNPEPAGVMVTSPYFATFLQLTLPLFQLSAPAFCTSETVPI